MSKYDKDGALLRDLRRPKHYTIDNEFLDLGYAACLGVYVSMAYNVLCRFANINTSQAFPSQQTISQLTGMSLRKAKEAIQLLLSWRIISVESHVGRGQKNIYSLLDSSEWASIKGVSVTPLQEINSACGALNNANSACGALNNELNSACGAPEIVHTVHPNKQREQTKNNNNNNGRCCRFSDEVLTALVERYQIQEPKAKLQQMIADFHITDQTELEKGLQVAQHRVTHPQKLLSYARKLFTPEGLCLENPDTLHTTAPQYDTDTLQRLREVLP